MGFLEDRDLSTVPTILEYYKGKTLFITGGTGKNKTNLMSSSVKGG
jgi:type IV secretory pathway ATPase VirB11/archaellum biosynthesis ATPase